MSWIKLWRFLVSLHMRTMITFKGWFYKEHWSFLGSEGQAEAVNGKPVKRIRVKFIRSSRRRDRALEKLKWAVQEESHQGDKVVMFSACVWPSGVDKGCFKGPFWTTNNSCPKRKVKAKVCTQLLFLFSASTFCLFFSFLVFMSRAILFFSVLVIWHTFL